MPNQSKHSAEEKIKNIDELTIIIENLKRDNNKIITTNGTFDIIHVGHIRYLKKAKKLGDILVVAINSDDSVKRLKGDLRPIVPENERAEILSSLEFVDYVVIFDDDKPLNVLCNIKPDYHIKGGSYIIERIKEEKELVESWGGQFKALEIDPGHSTTNLIKRIIAAYGRSSLWKNTNRLM